MEADRLPRKLAAILYADVAGYSRLTGEDEEGTHRRLRACLDLVSASVRFHNGSVVHYAGDAVLAEFPSVSEALICAVHVQQGLAHENEDVPDARRVQLRIGVNLGEVIVDRDDIYGDGVNVAARLESLAQPGGICTSGTVYDAVGGKLPLDFEFLGEQPVKNIAKPVRAYAVRLREGASLPAPATRARPTAGRRRALAAAIAIVVAAGGALLLHTSPWQAPDSSSSPRATATDGRAGSVSVALPAKPSLAVLPFNNLSGDPEQEYFSDGLTEDLITDLSRLSGLFVIARNSSFAYKGQAVDVQRVGRELGVRYVLEGSVRRAARRVRINAQLIDARTGTHLWANRYDRELTDVFALQDEVTRTIVQALAVELTQEEARELNEAPTADADAYDALLRGNELLSRFNAEDNAASRAFYEEAVRLDPGYARAYANLAFSHALDVQFDWSEDAEQSIRLGLEAADHALTLDDRIPQMYFTFSQLYLAQGRLDAAERAARRAVELHPNYADGHANLAVVLTLRGDMEEALGVIHKAMRLNPHYSFLYLWVEGRVLFHLERHGEARAALEEAITRNPQFEDAHIMLAATYAKLGRLEDAAWEVDEITTLRPGYSLGYEKERTRLLRDEDLHRLLDGLRKAGVPK